MNKIWTNQFKKGTTEETDENSITRNSGIVCRGISWEGPSVQNWYGSANSYIIFIFPGPFLILMNYLF